MKFIIKIYFYIIFIILYLVYISYFNSKYFHLKFFHDTKYELEKKILIEIDVSFSEKGKRGPGIFVKGIKDILPYNINNCIFVESKDAYLENRKNKYDFLYVPRVRFNETYFKKWINIREANKLILGPVFVPHTWVAFPNKMIWYEKQFKKILSIIKGIAIHSTQVRNHLISKSNTTSMINKYKIIRACTNLKPKYIKPFNNRTIDILFFEKYSRLNRSKQASQLIDIFRNVSHKNIVKLIYGKYKRKDMNILANNSKFIIYFSFYDTGAIGLKEIQNYGVFAFTHQKEFIIDKDTSFYIPELTNGFVMTYAFQRIIKIIENITFSNPNTQIIAKKNQAINKCENALKDLCYSL